MYMYVHTDTDDKYLILLNNIEIKTLKIRMSNTKIPKNENVENSKYRKFEG